MFGLFKRRTLRELIELGDVKKLAKVIGTNNVNQRDLDGNSLLFHALQHNNIEVLELLLEHGVELSLGERNERLPKLVIDTMNESVVKLMVLHAWELPTQIEYNKIIMPTLHYLIVRRCSQYQFIRFLVDSGVEIDVLDTHRTPALSFALNSQPCDKKVIELLIECGCSVDYAEDIYESPLYKALSMYERPQRDKIVLFELLLPHMTNDWDRYQIELLKGTITNRETALFLQLLSKIYDGSKVLEIENIELFLTAKNFTPAFQKQLIEINLSKGLDLPISIDIVGKDSIPAAKIVASSRMFFERLISLDIDIEHKIALIKSYKTSGGDMELVGSMGIHKAISPVMALTIESSVNSDAMIHLNTIISAGFPIQTAEDSALFYAVNKYATNVMKLLLIAGADTLFINKKGQTLFSILIDEEIRELKPNSILRLNEVIKIIHTTIDPVQFKALINIPFIVEGKEHPITFINYVPLLSGRDIGDIADAIISTIDINDSENIYTVITGMGGNNLGRLLELCPDLIIYIKDREKIITWALLTSIGEDAIKLLFDRFELSEDDTIIASVISIYNEHLYTSSIIINICEQLLQRGVRINALDDNQDGILSAIIKRGAYELFEWIFSKNIAIDFPIGEMKQPIAVYLCSNISPNSLIILKLLDRYGKLNINHKDRLGVTPLIAASGNCAVELVKHLLEKGANIETTALEDSRTPIMHAISYSPTIKSSQRVKCVSVMLDSGANINGLDRKGLSPLMIACYFGAASCVELLLERGANIALVDDRGLNAVNYATYGNWDYEYRKNHSFNEIIRANIIKQLISIGANINNVPKGPDLNPALINCIICSHIHLFDALIDGGANVNIKDNSGIPAIHYAIHVSGIEFIERLFAHPSIDILANCADGSGVWHALSKTEPIASIKTAGILQNINIPIVQNNFGEHPLHLAVKVGNIKLVKFFISIDKKSINMQDKYGRTPIFNIFQIEKDNFNRDEICKILIEAGVDINVRSVLGDTLLRLSQDMKLNAITELLINNGADIGMGRRKIGF